MSNVAPRTARGEGNPDEPWRSKNAFLSEATRAALAELKAIRSWDDLVRTCKRQQEWRNKHSL